MGDCPICKQKLVIDADGIEKPNVDHCHLSGKIRGIVHSRCNSIIGYAYDDVDTLKNAIVYLENNKP